MPIIYDWQWDEDIYVSFECEAGDHDYCLSQTCECPYCHYEEW